MKKPHNPLTTAGCYSAYQRYNPFRRPDWRWERVASLLARTPQPGRCGRWDDQHVRTARNWVHRWGMAEPIRRDQLFREQPGLCYAYAMHQRQQGDGSDDALVLQARLLSGMAPERIAVAMDTLPQAVEWYEALFFNVRDKLHARDWVQSQVIVPALMGSLAPHQQAQNDATGKTWYASSIIRPFLDGTLKLFAYHGGEHVCEHLVCGLGVGRPAASADDVPAWWDQAYSGTLKARCAQAVRMFEINRYNITELFQVYMRLLEIEKSADGALGRASDVEKHIGAMIQELPWHVGQADDGNGLGLSPYQHGAAELRDDELLPVAAGERSDVPEARALTMPPPRPRAVVPDKEGLL